jgi:hypothetical protein
MLRNTFFSLTTSNFRRNLFAPVLANLLEHRPTGLAITGAALLHAGLTLAGLPGWTCPIRAYLGIPCPGCGLSRAITALLQGDWQTSLTLHAFAPLFLIALILIAGITLLPIPIRHRFIQRISVIESHTGVTAIFLFSLVFYWLARLIILRAAFINLILG